MVRRFFRDSAIYALPAAVSSGTSFITFPLYAHHFLPAEYGVLDLASFASTLVVMTVALEVYQALGRYVTGEDDRTVRREYVSTALWWTVACYVVFGCLVLVFARPVSHALLGAGPPVSVLRVALAWTCVQGVLTLMQAQLRWQLRPKAYAIASAVNALCTAGAGLWFVFGAHAGVVGVLWGQLCGSAAALVLVALLTKGTFGLTFNPARLRKMLRFSTPLVISNTGVFLNLYADRFVILHLRSLADVGLYGVANRVAMLVTMMLMGFQGAALPLFLSRRNDPSAPRDIARIFRLFAVVALTMTLTLSIFAAPLLSLFAAPAYQGAADVVPFLVVSTAFANMYMFAPGLAIAERTRTMATLTLIAGVANLGLALLLVPPLGITGAGVATATTSLWWFVALMRASQRYYSVPHQWSGLAGAGLVTAGLIALCFVALPQSRAQAFAAGTLAARGGLLLLGIAISASLCLRNEERRNLLRPLSRFDPRARRSDVGVASDPDLEAVRIARETGRVHPG